MYRNILFIFLPFFIFISIFNFIPNQKELLLITLLATTIIFWASSLIPDYKASLIFLFGSLFFSIAPKEIIFSGFASSAFWLVFAGMLIATSIKNVKLSERFSFLFTKIKSPSYLKILVYISIFSFSFAFIMPSGVGRVVLLVPIGIMVAKNFGFHENSKGYIGILLTFILCTSIPAFSILTANAPNIILSGLATQIYNYEILYSHYLFTNFLIFGLLKNIIIVSIIYYFYKDTPKINQNNSLSKPLCKKEKIVLYTITTMIIFWTTDFIHGINPSIIAIVGVLFLMNNSIAVINTKDINNINFSSLIFLAGVIGLGSVTADNSFTKDLLSKTLTLFNFSSSSFFSYMQLSSFMAISATFLTQATVPAIFTPIVQQISELSGFNFNEIFMMQVAGFSTVFVPFQMPPLIIGITLANIKQKAMIKVLLCLVLITFLILFPLQYLWTQFFL